MNKRRGGWAETTRMGFAAFIVSIRNPNGEPAEAFSGVFECHRWFLACQPDIMFLTVLRWIEIVYQLVTHKQ